MRTSRALSIVVAGSLVALTMSCSGDSDDATASSSVESSVPETVAVTEAPSPTTDAPSSTAKATTTTAAPATAAELNEIAVDYFVALFGRDTDAIAAASGAELAAAGRHGAYLARIPDAVDRLLPFAEVDVTGELAIESQSPESVTTTGSLQVGEFFEATNLVFARVGDTMRLVDFQRAGETESEAVRLLAVGPNQLKVFSNGEPARIRGVSGGSLVSGRIVPDEAQRRVEYVVSIATDNELPVDKAVFVTSDGVEVAFDSITGPRVEDGTQAMLLEYTGDLVPDYGGTLTLSIGAADVVFEVPAFSTWDDIDIDPHPLVVEAVPSTTTVATGPATTAGPTSVTTTVVPTVTTVAATVPTAVQATVVGPGTTGGQITDSAAFGRHLAGIMLASIDAQTLGARVAFANSGLIANVAPELAATPRAVSAPIFALTAQDGENVMPIAIVDTSGRCELVLVAGLGSNNFAFHGPGDPARCVAVAAVENYEAGLLNPLDV